LSGLNQEIFRRIFALSWLGFGLVCQSAIAVEISDEEAMRPPSSQWLASTLDSSNSSWSEIESAARTAAVRADQKNRTQALEGWLLVAKWSRLLGSDQVEVTNRWVSAINTAQLGHRNMAQLSHPPSATLSETISPETTVALMSSPEFSRSFFDLLTPYDYLPKVLLTLDQIYQTDPENFREYEQLALAIALVFDVPPPPQWPHGQVTEKLLDRALPRAKEAFVFWVKSDRERKTLHRLNFLEAAELKFVVSAAAPLAELRWVQDRVGFDFEALPRTYDAVTYRTDRVEAGAYIWPGSSYALPTILREGGICIDQGYFASESGKARGVPTLLFRGVGLDGRHAWFGYLDGQKQWQFDVGRYAEQQYVSGVAFDPQTWGDVNDHELAFLAERFRVLPRYDQSRARQWLAEEFLRLRQFGDAAKSARRAVNHEPRNVAAWAVLQLAEEAGEVTVVKREATGREAARALQQYPDLHARFMRGVISLMRERGQTSAADHEERQLAKFYAADRSDLAIAQAAEILNRSLAGDDPATQLRVFESALRQFGVKAGMTAFDRLVSPFFRQALLDGRKRDALTILRITRRLIRIEAGSQFANELSELDRLAVAP